MPSTLVTLRAKFTPPSLRGVVARPALRAQLALLAECSVWLTAPSGAGKSTLVADYVAHEAPRTLWYRLDSNDLDPGYLFPTLGAALQERFALAPLPGFSDAFRGDEKTFVERFGNALTAQLDTPALIVFDDARAAAAPLDRLLTQLVLAAGDGLRCIFIADIPPPSAFFDAIMRRLLTVANDLDLRFSTADCEAAARQVRAAHLSGDELQALTGGHAGALVLACELLRAQRPGGAGPTRRDGGPVDRLHTHLLQKLLDDLPAPQRDLLLNTSPMPRLAAPLVDQVLEIEHSDEQLEALADRGLLIRYPSATENVYEAHSLVRQGARLLAQRALGSEAVDRMTERCAQVLQANALFEESYTLWLELGNVDAALTVLTALAQRYARAGQAGLLLAAIEKVPAARVEAEPEIALWTALAVTTIDEWQARKWSEIAYSAYAARGDETGMAVASATVLAAYASFYGDFNRLEIWLQRMAAHRSAGLKASAPWRGIVLLGGLCEFYLSDAEATVGLDFAATADALRALMSDGDAWPSADQQLVAARNLFELVALFQSPGAAQEIVLATEPLATDPNRSPALRAHWYASVVLMLRPYLDAAQLVRRIDALDAVAQECGLASTRLRTLSVRASVLLEQGKPAEAAALLPAIEALAVAAVPTEQAELLKLSARILLLQHRPVEALPYAERARAAASRAGLSPRLACNFTETLAYALAANGRFGEARAQMTTLQPLLAARQRQIADAIVDLLAYAERPAQQPELLARGFALTRAAEGYGILRLIPQVLAELCARALAQDIEPEFVRRMIELRALPPPSLAGPEWPWRIRIRLLGDFQLDIDGQRYRPQRKAQEKPLELLKLLACRRLEAPAGADKLWLEERLWPDAAPEAARKSLDMTIARLRRLLGSDEALEVADARVRLAPNQVWTDLDSLAQAAQLIQAEHDRRIAGRSVNTDLVTEALARLLVLYRGPPLASEDGEAWLTGLRHRTSNLFRLAVQQVDELTAASGGREMIAALERALAAEPLAEELTRALMRRHLALGEPAAALQAYQRCRDLLLETFGVGPAAATEALKQAVHHTAHVGGVA
jgi:ATP/maltotriose-dependent transcriptional regulator MalT/DNA-binding SARP family transcriptional activator